MAWLGRRGNKLPVCYTTPPLCCGRAASSFFYVGLSWRAATLWNATRRDWRSGVTCLSFRGGRRYGMSPMCCDGVVVVWYGGTIRLLKFCSSVWRICTRLCLALCGRSSRRMTQRRGGGIIRRQWQENMAPLACSNEGHRVANLRLSDAVAWHIRGARSSSFGNIYHRKTAGKA